MTATAGAPRSAASELGWLLDDLINRVGEVRKALVLSRDGLVMGASRGIGREEADYLAARGRTRPRGEQLDLVTILAETGQEPALRARFSPEERRLLDLCQRPCTVADLASDLDLPLGVVRVLAGDLVHQGLLEIRRQRPV